MLPLSQADKNQQGCTPISSNCIVWMGPDIPCINLCNGDTISDVTAKLAEELCNIMTQLDITTFDLTCFNPICPTPENFHDLVQFILNQICKIENCVFEDCAPGCGDKKCKEPPVPVSGCPDCVVNIAPCFNFTNELGDTITTMQLTDYVHAIGNRICGILTDISSLQDTVASQSTRIDSLEDCCTGNTTRIGQLEADISQGPSVCVIDPSPPGGVTLTVLVQALENAFCQLRTATGLPNDILLAIAQQCTGLDTSPSLASSGVSMGSLPGWKAQANYSTLSDSVNNMWITICDLRSAVLNIQNTCCPKGCEEVIVNLLATISGSTLTLFFSGSVPAGFEDCSPSGNLITITDSTGGSYTLYVPVISNLNSTGYNIELGSTPINIMSSLNIHLDGCFINPSTDTRCEKCIDYYLINTAECSALALLLTPNIILPNTPTIQFNFNSGPSTATYNVELWSADGTTLVSSQIFSPAISTPVSGTFSVGLLFSTVYKVRICITVGVGAPTCCPFTEVTTVTNPCPVPINVCVSGCSDPLGVINSPEC